MPLQVIGLEVVRYAGNHQLKMPKTSNPSDDVATWWREPILEEPKLLPSSVLHHLLTFPPTSCTSQQASELVQPRMTRAVRRDVRFTFTTQMIRMASSAPDSDASRAPPNRTAGQDRIFRRQRRVRFLLLLPHVYFYLVGWDSVSKPRHNAKDLSHIFITSKNKILWMVTRKKNLWMAKMPNIVFFC